jgi:hypothetical protein
MALPTTVSIAQLTEELPSWIIVARVIVKKPLQQTNTHSPYFRGIIMDEKLDGKAPVWFWGDAASRWFDILVEDVVYEFSGGKVEALGQYATAKMKYKISFAQFEPNAIRRKDDVSKIPHMRDMLVTDFLTLKNEIDGVRVAIEGRIKSVSDIRDKEPKSRVVSITDRNDHKIDLTLYGEQVGDVVPEMTGNVVCMFEVSVRNRWKPQLSGNAFMSIKLMDEKAAVI